MFLALFPLHPLHLPSLTRTRPANAVFYHPIPFPTPPSKFQTTRHQNIIFRPTKKSNESPTQFLIHSSVMPMPGDGSLLPIFLAVAGGLVLLRTILSWKSLAYCLGRLWRWLDERSQVYQYFDIPRHAEGGRENPLYRAAAAYVAALPSLEDAAAAALFSSGRKPNDFHLQLGNGQSTGDSFLGSRLLWTNVSSEVGDRLVLRVRRPDRTRVLRPYLQHVESVAEDLELRRREVHLYTTTPVAREGGGQRGWTSVPFTHPATLETVAMEPDLKNRVRADLEAFLKGRAYYHRLGRVWRRSYLLYGPTGTGKSTFVAAMAKFLCYDIYDVNLSRFSVDSAAGDDLKALLLATSPRSIILVEDLDRYLNGVGDGESRLTAVLNFMDGVFSCCGEERVMVFTMTTACGADGGLEGMEPAVLRPGRLDVHIHFPLCDFSAFKTLASSYLGLKDHKLYPQVEEVFQTGAKISPAEVGEIMIANRASPSRALKSVITALQQSNAGVGGRSSGGAAGSQSLSESGSTRRWGDDSGGMGFGKDSTMREIKKLYGLIKMRSGSKKEGVMSVEVAAAAAAAGAPLDKDYS